MKFVNEEFIKLNKENFRNSFKIVPTKIEKINLSHFVDNKLTIDTIENPIILTKEEFLNSEKDFYLATNVDFKNGIAYDKKAIQNNSGKEITDSWIINENLNDLGYKLIKDNLFVKDANNFVPVMEKKEELAVKVSWSDNPLQGKKGDFVAVYGKGDYNIIDKETFHKTYQFKETTIEDKIEFSKFNKTEEKIVENNLELN